MNGTTALTPDELLLAQLASAKLAKLIKGLMSVGVGALQLAAPSDFLAGGDQVLLAFIEVLRCTGVNPKCGEFFYRLRQQTDQLSDRARQFHRHFLELAAWRTMAPPEVRATANRLVANYTDFCHSLAAFRALIGVEADDSDQVQQGRDLISAFLNDCLPVPPASKAGG
jgi:hypothetical protein